MDFLSYYALFLAKTVTVVIAIIAVIVVITSTALRKRASPDRLTLTDLGERYRKVKEDMQLGRMKPSQKKSWYKAQKKREKQQYRQEKKQARLAAGATQKPVLYVIDFKGSMDAREVASLREEVSAVLAVATPQDEVLVRLESPGGAVQGYGLAASQLQRLRQKGIPLTVAVDKVAASGGYMMACVANRIVAAPFAVIGSVGVVAQIPNFNRLLKRNDIDIELHTAGQYKRTLTLLGENTQEGREKFREEINTVHQLFKTFVHQMRPGLDIDQIATGEHWYGSQALELKLIDAITTSDDEILRQLEHYEVLQVRFVRHKKMMDRFTHSSSASLEQLLLRLWQRGSQPLP